MKIHVGYDLVYECVQPTPMIFMLNVHRAADLLTADRMRITPPSFLLHRQARRRGSADRRQYSVPLLETSRPHPYRRVQSTAGRAPRPAMEITADIVPYSRISGSSGRRPRGFCTIFERPFDYF
jgi:hypothetical protein